LWDLGWLTGLIGNARNLPNMEGEIEVEIEGKASQPVIGEEVFIPANAVHTVRNVGQGNNIWYYGYRSS